MISEEHEEPNSRAWIWAIPLSALLHAFALPLALLAFASKLVFAPAPRPESEQVVATTAVRIERRPSPRSQGAPAQPAGQPVPQQAESRPAQPQPQTAPGTTPTPQPTPEPTKAPPVPRKQRSTPLQQQIATQQQTFQKEVARLRQRNQPLSIATVAPEPPASYHRSAFDVAGTRTRESAQALLFPTRHWMEGGMSCYYTRYVAQFSDGGTEDGVVPWPVCYAPADDRFAKFPNAAGVPLPIPYPPPGYVLPPGTYLSPFLKRIYTSGAD
jgi:outer membrane biosynthesis protein TonB